jgi:glycosyltransferase involved in cell wall biosynthesis
MLTWAEHSGYETILVIAPLGGEEPDEAALTVLAGAYPNLVVVYRDGRVLCRVRDNCDALAALNGKLCDQFATILGEPAVADDVLSAERTFAHDALIGVTRTLVDRLGPVAIIVNYIFMSRVFAVLPPKLIKIIDTHDVFSTKERKVKRYGIRDSLAISAQEEARLLKRADLIIAIQPDEELELKQLVPGKQVITVGVDFEVTTARNPTVPPTVLLVASANPMNKQAVNDFLEFAWPIIKKEVPDVVFRIAGAVGREIDVLDSQVEPVGHVDDLTRLYRAAKVVINPTIAGTGLKIKTIEALCHCCPVVVWPSGVDGLPSEAKGLCDIVENWYLFARATIAHLNFCESPPQVSQARASVLTCLFSADHVYADLAATLQ